MITVKFYRAAEAFDGCVIEGHSNRSEAGTDIVCAAVSAMTMLISNILINMNAARVSSDDERVSVDIKITDNNSVTQLLLKTFFDEIEQLASEYPSNLRILTIKK